MTSPEAFIPHRPPFLLLEDIAALDADAVTARACARADHPWWAGVFSGHYPGSPLVPGVLLCEMVFQAGAALMAHRAPETTGQPVLTRIQQAKFKRRVLPDEPLEVTARFVEQVGPAVYLKGSVKVGGELAVQVDFAVTSVPAGRAGLTEPHAR